MKKLVIMGAFLAAGCLASSQASQTARDNAFVSLSFANDQKRFVSVPVVRGVEFEGSLVSASGSNVTETGAFSSENFAEGAGDQKFELEFTSGRFIGLALPVVTNTADSITVAGLLPSNISAGTTYVVRKSWTPKTLFGSTSAAVAAKGVVANQTRLRIYNAPANTFSLTISWNGTAWKNAANPFDPADYGDSRLPQVFVVDAGAAGATTLRLAGEVRKTRSLFPVGNGNNVLGNPNAFASTLAKSGLYNVFGESSQEDSVAHTTDKVSTYNGIANTLSPYFYNNSASQWRNAANPFDTSNKDATVIGAAEGLRYDRTGVSGYVAVNPMFQ